MSTNSESPLSVDLEDIVLARFDKLLTDGEILYVPPRIDIMKISNFQFQITTTTILLSKPVLDPEAEGRSKAVGPFVDPPLSFIVANIGTTHRVIINKFCVYRPMLVLHTREFELQTDDLNETDLTAAWGILQAFKTPQMVIYNCGVQSGSSQGHKHLQIFPRNGDDAVEPVKLWPEAALSTCCSPGNPPSTTTTHPSIPFTHFLSPLTRHATAPEVFATYRSILTALHTAAGRRPLRTESGTLEYNLILVAEWMVLIPRKVKNVEGLMMGNAATMVGLVWSHTEALRDRLVEMGEGVVEKLGEMAFVEDGMGKSERGEGERGEGGMRLARA